MPVHDGRWSTCLPSTLAESGNTDEHTGGTTELSSTAHFVEAEQFLANDTAVDTSLSHPRYGHLVPSKSVSGVCCEHRINGCACTAATCCATRSYERDIGDDVAIEHYCFDTVVGGVAKR